MKHKKIDADVVVVGGGIGGTCAAIAAARHGCKTVLLQDRTVLGGNASSEVRVHVGGASWHGYHRDARESGVIEEIRLETAVRDPYNTYSAIDMVLYTFCEREKNLTLLLGTHVHDVTRSREGEKGQEILSVRGITAGSETEVEVSGRVFIDGTGHGTLGALAGASWRMGREGHEEFKEPAAPPVPDNFTLGASILFRGEDVGRPVEFEPPEWAIDFSPGTGRKPPRFIGGKNNNHERFWHGDVQGWWWVERGGDMNTIHDNDAIRHELQAIVYGTWDYIKNHHPLKNVREEARDFDITWIGSVPGHRESRRLVGDHLLTQHDLERATAFEDQVAVGGWSVDLHPPRGFWDTLPSAMHHALPGPYSIPLRSIYSKDVANLLVASRCISATHAAHGSTRLIGTLALIGQAAGTAAAKCVADHCSPRDIATDATAIATLQQDLLRDDHWLLDLPNEDPGDKARVATVTSTSEYPCMFDTVDNWVPVFFPLAQRFFLSPGERKGSSPVLYLLLKNESGEEIAIEGGMRRDPDGAAFSSTGEAIAFTALVPAGASGFFHVTTREGSEALGVFLAPGGQYWVHVDAPAVDGLFWGMHAFHWPGTSPGYYHEDTSEWRVHRSGNGMQFYDDLLGKRGTFCFKIDGTTASPYPASAINNGFHRPSRAGPNLWVSAPALAKAYHPPRATGERSYHGLPPRDNAGPPKRVEIHVDFPAPTEISEVLLTMDTDLDAPFPHQDYGAMRIKEWPVIGKAPDCISAMDVFVDKGGSMELVAAFTGNYMRRVRLALDPPVTAKRLVLVPKANWGFHCFGLYELRVY